MSSVTLWHSSRAVSSEDSGQPLFEQSEYFHRTAGGWSCSACPPSRETHLHPFNATAALKHEKSRAHKKAVERLTSWGPVQVDNWGQRVEPYQQLRYDLSRAEDPLRKRVKRWIKDMEKAEGIEVEEDSDEESSEHDDWTDWGGGGNDWMRPPEEWGMPVDATPVDATPVDATPADDEYDLRAAADFKFVEKVARARGLTKDRRRLHAFYRLPTEEKIIRIQEIVHFISCH